MASDDAGMRSERVNFLNNEFLNDFLRNFETLRNLRRTSEDLKSFKRKILNDFEEFLKS